jgi:multiple sugar transport system substrate-binding protein/raffinose/stachyose/melibiose transport system substrate-binding protein
MKKPFERGWRRSAVAAAALMLTAAGLSACSSGSGSSSGGPTVTVWSWRSQDQQLWQTVQSDLAKQGTKVNIQFRGISPTSYDSVLQTAMNGGQGPDIFYDRAGEGTETYAAAHLAQPLNGFVNTSGIDPSAVATAQYNGKTYGVPFAIQTMSVFYNKDVLSKYHMSVPTTWSGWLSEMQKLKSSGVTPMYVMGVQQWMLSLQIDTIGASAMQDSYTKALTAKQAKYSDPPFVKTLTAFKQLAPYLESNWQAVGSSDTEQETALALGKCAFVIDGIFDTPEMKKVNPNVHLGQFLVPSPDGGQSKIDWYVDGEISMNSKIGNSAEKKAAQKIMAFTAKPAFGTAFSDIAGEISPINGVKVPAKYPLSVQAEKWYQSVPISPIFGIRSPMDTPPPNPAALKKSKSPDSTAGIFTAEQNIAVPLLQGKTSPQQAADQVQQAEQWYFNGTAPPAPSPSASH